MILLLSDHVYQTFEHERAIVAARLDLLREILEEERASSGEAERIGELLD